MFPHFHPHRSPRPSPVYSPTSERSSEEGSWGFRRRRTLIPEGTRTAFRAEDEQFSERGDTHSKRRGERSLLAEDSGEADSAQQRSPLIPLPAGESRVAVPAELQEQKPACDQTTDQRQKPVVSQRRSFPNTPFLRLPMGGLYLLELSAADQEADCSWVTLHLYGKVAQRLPRLRRLYLPARHPHGAFLRPLSPPPALTLKVAKNSPGISQCEAGPRASWQS